eukprot:TRINITY_DN40462_c0_g1_i1.p1 TRINITY_DN40462_c0_g1~~TRINITY_DN40462_c0_g1_i1.p1  ORF type:complete len:656 (+),score=85.30 TRINITY_DN40462_c0_g1_i1:61-2028(+)
MAPASALAPAGLRYVDRGVEKIATPAAGPETSSKSVTETVSSGSSPAVRDYQDKLKAIELQRRGVEKSAVAAKLGRPERWVQKWWKQEPRLIPRPHGAQDAVFQRVPLAGFRDLEITRGFTQDQDLFDVLLKEVPWRQGKVMTRDTETGELVLRFDRRGSTIPASRLVADCPRGISALDSLLQKAFTKANIRDPQARVVLNLYTDGGKQLNSHRHDFWTCLISLGSPRVLLVDNRPHVMENGDMIVFGTQMHGVPPMPEVAAGRISLVIFFYPDRDNLERRWLTVLDGSSDQAADDDDDDAAHADLVFCDDCRTGSASSNAVPGSKELAAVAAAVDPEAVRTRPHWRKTNAELQFMEYPQLPQAHVYSAGCEGVTANELVGGLLRQGVAWLWDLRVGRAGGLHSESLREACRGRLHYRSWPLGTASAGGLSRHLFRTEEGVTLVYRLLREAQHSLVCFLGPGADWRTDDTRLAVGYALTLAGSRVAHFNSTIYKASGATESSGWERSGAADCHLLEWQATDFQLPAHLRATAVTAERADARYSCSDTSAEGESSVRQKEQACMQPQQDGCLPVSPSSVDAQVPEARRRWSRRTESNGMNALAEEEKSADEARPGCQANFRASKAPVASVASSCLSPHALSERTTRVRWASSQLRT